MSWLQLKVTVRERDAEALSQMLSEAGAASVTLTDAADSPVYEPLPGTEPLWANTTLTGLFAEREDLQTALGELETQRATCNLSEITVEQLLERDWVEEGQKNFPVLQFGRLWIVPEGCEPDAAHATVVVLQPGIAFGTGTHPTTALCLKWLSRAALSGKRLLDYGCGSGILAIAAAKLGAAHVVCVDHDTQALESTQRNAINNKVLEKISIHTGDITLQREYDLILANILLNPLLVLAPKFADLLLSDGTLVLSGVTEDQLPELEAAYSEKFRITQVEAQDHWLRVTATRRT